MSKKHSFFDERAETWEQDNPVSSEKLSRVIGYCRLKPGQTILDVGTGTGRLVPLILQATGCRGTVYAVDPSEGMLEQARSRPEADRVRFIQAPAEQLPFDKNFFDRSICYAVFPHFFNRKQAVAQLAGVLKPGGLMVIAHTEGRETINSKHRDAGEEVAGDRLPPVRQVADLLDGAGLQPEKLIDEDDFYLVAARKVSYDNR